LPLNYAISQILTFFVKSNVVKRQKNTYFQFKQFRIDQAHTAMKVSTEACILGAWAFTENPQKILDIGTGTGLLSLMLAQRFPNSQIEAVEIEKDAFRQAQQNISHSPFYATIHLHHTSIQDFAQSSKASTYDLIVCNPPFYANYLQSPDEKLNMALHQNSLPLEDLAEAIVLLLASQGRAFILLPPFFMEKFCLWAKRKNLFPQKKLHIFHSPKHPILREIAAFGFYESNLVSENLFIRNEKDEYTNEFKTLLKDFYLHF
jgi:tRNA1Val (adenine37-N6)-methyltransferase